MNSVEKSTRSVDVAEPTPKEKPKADSLPQEAVRLLKEGEQTTFANGQVWTLKDGKPVRVK
jgi:hypothetical protein